MVLSRLFLPALAGLFLLSPSPAPAQGRTPWLGVYLDQGEEGLVEIQQVLDGSPAKKAGLRAGDLILACDQVPVPTVESLIERVHKMKPGRKVKFRVLRGRKKLDILVTLGAAPGEAVPPSPPGGVLPLRKMPARAVVPARKARPKGPRTLRSRKDLDQVLQEARKKGEGKPILLEFNAPWCGPGKVLDENLSRSPLKDVLRGFFGLYKVDVDQCPSLADRYKVDGIPHLQVIDDRGRPLGKVVGAVEPARVARRLRRFLKAEQAPAVPGKKEARKAKGLHPVRRKSASPRGEDTNERILQELIRIRKLLEEIKNRMG